MDRVFSFVRKGIAGTSSNKKLLFFAHSLFGSLLIFLVGFFATLGILSPQTLLDRLRDFPFGNQQPSTQAVLEAATKASAKKLKGDISFNLPSIFNDDMLIKADASVSGTLTAPNILYSLVAGQNITISGDRQRPTISVATASGVTTFQGETGEVALIQGDGITVDGLTITNTDPGSGQDIFNTIQVGSTLISAVGNNDTFQLAAGSGISLATDTGNNKITITATGGSSGSTTMILQEGDTSVSTAATTIDFLGGDFDLTESPVGEGNVQLASTLTSVTGVSGNFSIGGTDFTFAGETFTDLSGDGLVTTSNALGINLTTSGNTGATSSNSGLEVGSDGLTLLKGCADGELLKYTDATGWACSSDAGGGGSAIIDVENNDADVGASVDTLDFSTDFNLTASPLNEANIALADDIINFTEFSDSLTLDAATTITNALAGNFTIDLTSTGDFVIADSGTPFFTFTDSGALTQAGSGLVALTGNVDATSGLDVSGADLTVGGTSATITTAGAITGTQLIIDNLRFDGNTLDSTSGNVIIDAASDTIRLADLTTNGVVYTSGGNGTLNSELQLSVARGGTGVDGSTVTDGQLLIGNDTANGFTLANLTAGSGISITNGSGSITISQNGSGASKWTQNDSLGVLYPNNATVDVLFGGTSTSSAKFAFLNNAGNTPTASISAGSGNNAVFLTGTGVLGTTNAQTLMLGGTTTGDVVIDAGSGLITLSDNTLLNGSLTVTGASDFRSSIANSTGNLVLADTVDLGSATTGVNIAPTGEISDNNGNLLLNDSTDVTGNLDVSGSLAIGTADALQVDATGNITSTGTTGLTFSGAGAGIVFGGSGNHAISASSGVLQFGAATLTGEITGGSQTISGLGQLTVDNLRLDGNTLDATSGNLILDSAGNTRLADLTTDGVVYTSGTNGTLATEAQLSVARGGTGVDGSTVTDGQLLIGNDTANGFTLANLTAGSGISITNGSGSITISQAGAGASKWTQNDSLGVLYPNNATVDVLFGGTSTSSAKFAFLNNAGNTPTASISAGSGNNALSLDGAGNIGTTNEQTLTLGSASTGDINLILGAGNQLRINGTAGQTLGTASCVTTTNGLVTGTAACPVVAANAIWNTGSGAIFEGNVTQDLLIGGISTAAAKFAITNVAGGTPTATLSAGISGGAFFTADGSLQTTTRQSLTFGGGGTGDIVLSGFGAGIVHSNASGVLSSSAVNLASSDVTGVLPLANGGTGLNINSTTIADGQLLIGSDTGNGFSVANLTAGSGITITNGSGAITISQNGSGASKWTQDNSLGTLTPNLNTLDIFFGGATSSSAKFAFLNNAGNTPTASISANNGANALSLDGAGNISTTNEQTLTLGSDATGDINLVLGAGNQFRINGTAGQTLGTASCVTTTNGIVTGTAACPSVAANSIWNTGSGAIFEGNITQDLLIGGISTAAAKFAITNVAGGTPTATLSAGISGGAYFSADGTLQTTAKQTLSLGGTSTGNIAVSPNGGNGLLSLNVGSLTINGVAGATSASPTCVSVSNGIVVGTGSCGAGAGGSLWTLATADGTIYPINSTVDLLVGGTSTASARFAITNVAGGSPTATLSGGLSGGAYLSANGTLQTTTKQTLTIGGTTTGNVIIDSGSGLITLTDNTTITQDLTVLGGDITGSNGESIDIGEATDGSILFSATGATNNNSLEIDLESNAYPTFTSSASLIGIDADLQFVGDQILTSTGDLTVNATGDIILSDFNNCSVLTTVGTTLTCGTTDAASKWNIVNGTIQPKLASTLDFLLGGTSTASAKFAITNINSNTPTATLSAGVAGGMFLSADGSLQTTTKQSLTIGGGDTGNIVLSGFGTGIIHSNASGVLSSSAVNLASADVTGVLPVANGGTGVDATTVGDGQLLIGNDGANGFTLGNLTAGSGITITNGPGSITISQNGSGASKWTQDNSLGILTPNLTTLDLLVGGATTQSAKFAFLNNAGNTPTASISANSGNNSAFLTGTGILGTTNEQTLTLGSASTGDINLVLGAGNQFRINGALGQTVASLSCVTTTNGIVTGSGNCPGNSNANFLWNSGSGAIFQGNVTQDLLIGGTATSSSATNYARAGFLNIAGSLTPVATLSAGTSGGTFFTAAGALQTTARQSLILGGGNTGNIVLSGFGTGIVHSNASGVLTSSAVDLASGDVTGILGIANGGSPFEQTTTGAITQRIITQDVLFGGNATDSAKFAFLNNAGNTPTASISAGSDNNALSLDGAGNIATTNEQTLTLGSATTGDINFVLGAGNQMRINGTAGATVSNAGCVNTLNGVVTSVGACAGGSNWDVINGVLTPKLSSTVDFLLGGVSTASAKFAVLNIHGSATPVASVSATNTGLGLSMSGNGTLQSLRNGSLTIGGDTTGNIILSGRNGSNNSIYFMGYNCNGANGGALTVDATGLVQCSADDSSAGAGTLDLKEGNGAAIVSGTTILNFDASDFNVTTPGGTQGDIAIDYGNSGIVRRNNSEVIGGQWSFLGDILAGGTSTASARFGVLNMMGSGTPTATLSANSGANALSLTGTGVIGTTNEQTLTLGSASTGDINLVLGAGNQLRINGTLGQTVGTAACVTTTNGLVTGTAACPNVAANNIWNTGSGTIFQGNVTQDLLIGGTATNSSTTNYARAGFLNIAGSLTPVATLSAGVNGGTYFTAAGILATTAKQDLTLGGSTTGNIILQPQGGTGRVGIGTATPARDLEIASETVDSTYIKFNPIPGAGPSFSEDWSVGSDENGFIVFNDTDGQYRMTIDEDGNIGVGTTDPVTGGFTRSIDITGDSNGASLVLTATNGKRYAIGSADSPEGLYFRDVTDDIYRMMIDTNGRVGINTQSLAPLAMLDVEANAAHIPVALLQGDTSAAGLIVDNTIGDIFAASAGGTTRFRIAQNGNIITNDVAGQTISSATCVTTTNGIVTGSANCPGNSSANFLWNSGSGAIFQGNVTQDLLIGGTATNSSATNYARAGFLNIAGSLTPVATLSAGVSGGTFFTAAGSLQTTARQSLVLGGGNTGNIVLSGFGTGILKSNASGVLSSSAIDLASSDVTGILGIANGGSPFEQTTTGAITQRIITQDILFGGIATNGARFAFLNNAGSLTPTASISANAGNNSAFLTGTGILGTTNEQTLTLGSAATGDLNLVVGAGNQLRINGTAGQTLASASCVTTANGIVTGSGNCPGNSNANFLWNSGSGAIFQGNVTQDLLIGGTATNSSTTNYARAGFLNIAGSLTPVATLSAGTSGGAFLTADGNLATTANQTLSLGGATTGNLLFNPLNGTGFSLFNGRMGINATNPLATLDLRANSGTLPIASLSGQTSNAGLIVDNRGAGDIFTASSSGQTRFVITQGGTVGIGTSNPNQAQGLQVAAAYTPTQDLVRISNATVVAPTGNGINGLLIDWNARPSSGNIQAGLRFTIDNNNNSTGGLVIGNRIVASGAGGSVSSQTIGMLIDGLDTPSSSIRNQNALQIGGNWDSSIFGETDLRINANGNIVFATSSASTRVAINTTAPLATFDVRGNTGTIPVASFSGNTSVAGLFVDNRGSGDLFTASASGVTRFTITQNGSIITNGVTGQTVGSAQCVTTTNGIVTGTGTCDTSSDPWQGPTAGAVYLGNTTLDLLVGGTATNSSKFAILNMAGNTPTASLSAGTAGGAFLTATGNIGTTANQTLSLGGATTGNLLFNPLNGTGFSLFNGRMGINAANPLATLDLRASSGTLPIASLSGQTSNAGLIVDNRGVGDLITASTSGMTRFVIKNNGIINATAVGLSPNGFLGHTLDVTIATPSSSLVAGNYLHTAMGFNAPTTTAVFGTFNNLTYDGSANQLGDIIGSINQVSWDGSGNSTGGRVIGLTAKVNAGGAGAIQNAYGVFTDNTYAGGTVTNSYGMYINDPRGGATVTNNYGLYIAPALRGSSVNYALYSAGGENFFGGNVGIGVDPDSNLHVLQSSAGTTGFKFVSADNGFLDPGNFRIMKSDGVTAVFDFQDELNRIRITGGSGFWGSAGLEVAPADGTSLAFEVLGNSTVAIASIAANTSFAGMVFDNRIGDLLTASSSGLTRFTVKQNGDIALTRGISLNGSVGTGAQCLLGGATATWGSCGAGSTPNWDINTTTGVTSPRFARTLDVLIGGVSTASARAGFLNIAGSLTPVATLSAGTTGGTFFTAAGALRTTAGQTLAIGDTATTGNVVVQAGSSPTGIGRHIFLTAGSGDDGSLAGVGGNITIAGGSGTDSGGNVTINGGSPGIGNAGLVNIGTSNTRGIVLGNAGSGTSYTLGNLLSCSSIQTNGSGVLSCGSGGSSNWDVSAGVIRPKFAHTLDLILGGTATRSSNTNYARAGFLNINSALSTNIPTATLSAGVPGGVSLTANGNLQTTAKQTLTIGGNTTGNVRLVSADGISTFDGGVANTISLTSGAGGTGSSNDGGNGGALTLTSGAGGTGAAFGGDAGTLSLAGGTGGAGGDGGGLGGNISLTGGTGGLDSGVGATGGTGGTVTITGGTGGNTSAGSVGDGGNVIIQAGAPGGTPGLSSAGVFIRGPIGTGSSNAFRVQNGAGTVTIFNIDSRSTQNAITLGVNSGIGNVQVLSNAGHQAGLMVIKPTGVGGDIFTASVGATPRFSITNAGGIRLGTSEGTSNQCLLSGGAGSAASWGSCGASASNWDVNTTLGVISPKFARTLDLLLGGVSTASARAGFLNIAGSLTPVATLSAGTTGGAFFTADGNFGTTRNQTLTIGGLTTGNVAIPERVTIGTITSNTAAQVLIQGQDDISGGAPTALVVNGGRGFDTGVGGTNGGDALTVTGGTGGDAIGGGANGGAGGNITLTGGTGGLNDPGGLGGFGGDITITGGTASGDDADGGDILLRGGTGTGTGRGGIVTIRPTVNSASGSFRIQDASGTDLFTAESVQNNLFIGANKGTGQVTVHSNAGGRAALVVNKQGNSGDIFAASMSGTPRFAVTGAGGIRLGTSEGTNGNCLLSGGAGSAATWGSCAAGAGSNWDVVNGVIVPKLASTLDLLIGGISSTSARFHAYGSNPLTAGTTPSASISGRTSMATLIVDNANSGLVGDIFTASSSGLTRFTIKQSGVVVIGNNTNGITFDYLNGGPNYEGLARPTKKIVLSPEFSGAVLTASGSSTTTGNMTSDASTSANLTLGDGVTNNFLTYYEWTSSTATPLQDYTIALRVTLPPDFSSWTPGGSAMQVLFNTELPGTGSNRLEVKVVPEGQASNNSAPAAFYQTQTSTTAKTWRTINISANDLNDTPSWNTASRSAMIFLKMHSMNNNHVQIGDIILNYLSKF